MQKTTPPGHVIEEVSKIYLLALEIIITISNLPKVLGAKFLGSDWRFCFSSICKFGSFRKLLQKLPACLNFAFDSEDLFFCELWQQHKLKTTEMSEVWPDTYDEGYMHQFLNPFTKSTTSSSNSTEFKDILPWNISQMIMKTIPVSTRIVISYAMKWGISLWISWKVNGNWDNNMIRIS